MVTCVPGGRARSALAAGPGARFADVRWVAETGSTNADALELARQGEPEGIVLVADHQTAGRGRAGRTWTAPPGAGLLLSVLLRPPAAVDGPDARWRWRVAAAAAVESVAGFAPRLKWPNDLVWPGDGSAPDRKLAGILAEADWPAGVRDLRRLVAAGAGRAGRGRRRHRHQRGLARRRCPPTWPTSPWPSTTSSDAPVDREDLLIALLSRARPALRARWCAGDRDAAARRVAAALGHARPPGPGRPRHRRRRGHRRRRHRRRPPRRRDARGRPPHLRRRRRRPPPP